jgi:hypothetical protein
MRSLSLRLSSALVVATTFSLFVRPTFAGPCPQEPPLVNFEGPGQVACPCFVEGEEAGSIFDAPAAHYPIQILKVGIGGGSQFGGAPTSLESAINFYGASLPNPGLPIASLPGPQMSDGFINEFDIEAQMGAVTVPSGPFTVTLEFLNDNAGNFFAPSVVHDGAGCDAGENVVFAIPGGWFDACALSVSGDWVFYVIYRPNCATGIDEAVLASTDARLFVPRPNPFTSSTNVEFLLARHEAVDVSVYDVAGRHVATILDGVRTVGAHAAQWSGERADGSRAPAGVYFVRLTTPTFSATQKVMRVR